MYATDVVVIVYPVLSPHCSNSGDLSFKKFIDFNFRKQVLLVFREHPARASYGSYEHQFATDVCT